MASLSLSPSSSLSSSSSTLSSRFSLNRAGFVHCDSSSRPNNKSIKCDMSRSSDFHNGKTCLPVFYEQSLPNFMDSKPVERTTINSALRIFSGTANPALAQEIACYMGLELGKMKIKRFVHGIVYVELEESVRGCDVFLVQSTCPPMDENHMELFEMIAACKRASANTITVVIPYFGCVRPRAERKGRGFEVVTAELAANLLSKFGADRVIVCDFYSSPALGYFDIPVDHVFCEPVILDYLASKTVSSNDLVLVSPDVGGVARARAFAKKLSHAPLAIVDGHNVDEAMNLIGDVEGKIAVIVDKIIDSAEAISKVAALLHKEGAREVYACCTHAVFSPTAIERLSSGLFQELIVTNTVPFMEKSQFPQLTVLSVANLLAEAIWRAHRKS